MIYYTLLMFFVHRQLYIYKEIGSTINIWLRGFTNIVLVKDNNSFVTITGDVHQQFGWRFCFGDLRLAMERGETVGPVGPWSCHLVQDVSQLKIQTWAFPAGHIPSGERT